MARKYLQRLGFGLVALTLMSGVAYASERGDYGIQFDASTFGTGATLGLALGAHIELVLGAASTEREARYTDDDDNILTADLEAEGQRIGVQFYPFSDGAMRLELGMVRGALAVNGTVQNMGEAILVNGAPLTFRGESVSGTEAGTIRAKIEVGGDDPAPYLSFGWGRISRSGLRLTFNMGLAQYEKPRGTTQTSGCDLARDKVGRILETDVALAITVGKATLDTACTAAVNLQLAELQKDFERETDKYEYYPIIMLGLAYGF